MDAYEREFLAQLERVIGPTQQENHRNRRGPWWFRGAYHGHPVRVGLFTRGGLNAMIVGAAISDLPIRMLVNARSNTTIYTTPEVRTGDAAFDAGFLVNGFPEEVVAAVLDEATRNFLLTEYPTFHGNVSTEGGWLTLGKGLRSRSGFNPKPPLPPAELERYVRATVDMAMRLIRGFTERRAEIQRTQGGDAAFAWEKRQHDLVNAVGATRTRIRIYVGVALVAFLLMIFGTIFGIAMLLR